MDELKQEEEESKLPQYRMPQINKTFTSREDKERRLYENFLKVNQDVQDMIKEIQEFKVR